MVILAIVTILAAVVLHAASRNSRAADYSRDSAAILASAEAGMNLARSSLWTAHDPTLPYAVSPVTTSLGGHTITYWGEYDATTSVWKLVGQASGPHPANAGERLTRAVESQVAVEVDGVAPPRLWGYTLVKPHSGCARFDQNGFMDAPLRVIGDVCFLNNAQFLGEELTVSGEIQLGNNADVGVPADPVEHLNVAGGCTTRRTAPHPCGPADGVYAVTSLSGPVELEKPTVDWTGAYSFASPGPNRACVMGTFPGGFDNNSSMDGSLPPVNLTPATSYDCRTTLGRIAWNATTNQLIVDGLIFIDGSVSVTGATAAYDGQAALFARGSVTIENSVLCGAIVSGSCSTAWDREQDTLVFVAYAPGSDGFILANNSEFQGGAFVDGDYQASNNAVNWGPVIADGFLAENNGTGGQFTAIPIPFGLPNFANLATPFSLVEQAGTYRSYTP